MRAQPYLSCGVLLVVILLCMVASVLAVEPFALSEYMVRDFSKVIGDRRCADYVTRGADSKVYLGASCQVENDPVKCALYTIYTIDQTLHPADTVTVFAGKQRGLRFKRRPKRFHVRKNGSFLFCINDEMLVSFSPNGIWQSARSIGDHIGMGFSYSDGVFVVLVRQRPEEIKAGPIPHPDYVLMTDGMCEAPYHRYRIPNTINRALHTILYNDTLLHIYQQSHKLRDKDGSWKRTSTGYIVEPDSVYEICVTSLAKSGATTRIKNECNGCRIEDMARDPQTGRTVVAYTKTGSYKDTYFSVLTEKYRPGSTMVLRGHRLVSFTYASDTVIIGVGSPYKKTGVYCYRISHPAFSAAEDD